MTDAFTKMVDEAAADLARDRPVELGEAVKRLDKHLSGENTELWLAWCSVRQAFLKGRAISEDQTKWQR